MERQHGGVGVVAGGLNLEMERQLEEGSEMGHIVKLPGKTRSVERRGKLVTQIPRDRSGMNPPLVMALADHFRVILFPFKLVVFEQDSK